LAPGFVVAWLDLVLVEEGFKRSYAKQNAAADLHMGELPCGDQVPDLTL
jgi:hypothetical protein